MCTYVLFPRGVAGFGENEEGGVGDEDEQEEEGDAVWNADGSAAGGEEEQEEDAQRGVDEQRVGGNGCEEEAGRGCIFQWFSPVMPCIMVVGMASVEQRREVFDDTVNLWHTCRCGVLMHNLCFQNYYATYSAYEAGTYWCPEHAPPHARAVAAAAPAPAPVAAAAANPAPGVGG